MQRIFDAVVIFSNDDGQRTGARLIAEQDMGRCDPPDSADQYFWVEVHASTLAVEIDTIALVPNGADGEVKLGLATRLPATGDTVYATVHLHLVSGYAFDRRAEVQVEDAGGHCIGGAAIFQVFHYNPF